MVHDVPKRTDLLVELLLFYQSFFFIAHKKKNVNKIKKKSIIQLESFPCPHFLHVSFYKNSSIEFSVWISAFCLIYLNLISFRFFMLTRLIEKKICFDSFNESKITEIDNDFHLCYSRLRLIKTFYKMR